MHDLELHDEIGLLNVHSLDAATQVTVRPIKVHREQDQDRNFTYPRLAHPVSKN